MYTAIQNLHIPRGLISVIGSGGKTTFLRRLSECLDGTVILTTSTHIYPFPDLPLIPGPRTTSVSLTSPASPACIPEDPACVSANSVCLPKDSACIPEDSVCIPAVPACIPEDPACVLVDPARIQEDAFRSDAAGQIQAALEHSRVICLGAPLSSGKLGSPTSFIPFEQLLPLADYVLVEADGSACHPLKAHRSHEPVIPACSCLTICLVGASGIGKPIRQVCHCPELFADLAESTLDEPVTTEHIARVLNKENLADFYLVNQVDTLDHPETAHRLCDQISKAASAVSLKYGI